MPTVTFSGLSDPVAAISLYLDDLFEGEEGDITFGFSQIVVNTPIADYTVNGMFLPPATMDGDPTGTIDQLIVEPTSGGTLTISQVGLTIEELIAAYDLENDPVNPDVGAVEDILLNLDWNVTYGDADDKLSSKSTTADGIRLTFNGDDEFNMGAGNDRVDTSLGRDTVSGGIGDDTINGGKGKDRLLGDDGNDEIIGGQGKDFVRGGKGNDVLLGGGSRDNLSGAKGRDTLEGGEGDDKLTGGLGDDIFVFNAADSTSDFDTIFDFEVGADVVQFLGGVDAHFISFNTVASGVELDWNGNTILFENVTQIELENEIGSTIFFA